MKGYHLVKNKNLMKIADTSFKTEFKLNITHEMNPKIVNVLDVTLNLNTKTNKPYNKPNNNPLYININLNHSPSVIKNLPENIQKKYIL